jgi:hypothetical protein
MDVSDEENGQELSIPTPPDIGNKAKTVTMKFISMILTACFVFDMLEHDRRPAGCMELVAGVLFSAGILTSCVVFDRIACWKMSEGHLVVWSWLLVFSPLLVQSTQNTTQTTLNSTHNQNHTCFRTDT